MDSNFSVTLKHSEKTAASDITLFQWFQMQWDFNIDPLFVLLALY